MIFENMKIYQMWLHRSIKMEKKNWTDILQWFQFNVTGTKQTKGVKLKDLTQKYQQKYLSGVHKMALKYWGYSIWDPWGQNQTQK